MATNWQQLGPVKAKVVGDKTLVTRYVAGHVWDVVICSDSQSGSFEDWYDTEALAMAAADAIYDPPPKPIEAADRGELWSFWKSADGTRVATVLFDEGQWWSVPSIGALYPHGNRVGSKEAAELAAAKYVGGKG